MTLAPFSLEKTAQASAVFLRRAPGHKMSRMRLLKLLVIADREAIKIAGRPITGDAHVAMTHGPVLSKTYAAICEKGSDAALWTTWMGNSGKDVALIVDPGDGALSTFEVELLAKVESDFRNFTTAQLRAYTHEMSDWKKHDPGKQGMNPIPIEDTLKALGLSGKKQILLAAAKKEQAARSAFARFGG